jgi:hypothetical protein
MPAYRPARMIRGGGILVAAGAGGNGNLSVKATDAPVTIDKS